jgi:hypothetical protein
MSWTIESNNRDDINNDLEDLHTSIKLADREGILMFCSASDQGSNSLDTCYPGAWKTCIRIGAATETGDKFSWVHEGQVDFLLPGEITLGDSTLGAPNQSGSSVATAIASGLAGLLLLCSRLVADESEDSQAEKSYFRKSSNIDAAFKTMSKGRDQKFPRVEAFFKPTFKDLDWGLYPDDSSKALAALMAEIKVRLNQP